MDIKHKQKVYEKQINNLSNIFLAVLLSILAVILGVQFGNIWYKLDVNMVSKIDSESFKNVFKLSLPIVESVYNSGKSSVSFSGEVKDLFAKVFDFDLDSPTTILNAQSPLFSNYHNIGQKALVAQQNANGEEDGGTGTGNNPGTGQNADSGDNPVTGKDPGTDNPVGNADNTGKGNAPGSGNPAGTGDNGGAGTGENAGEGTGSGQTTGDPGQTTGDPGQTTGDPGQSTSDPGRTTNDPGQAISEPGRTTGDQGQAAQPGGSESGKSNNRQPVSSIAYEEEEDEDEDDSDLLALDKMVLRNFTKFKIDINALLKKPLNLNLSKKGPKVLIYHTHTTESYVLKESDLGKKDVPSYNSNPRYNVVRVGEELARNLKKYGIEVLHNGTVHDKYRPSAYSVSIDTLQSYKKSYPSIQVFVDLHRDAVGSEKPKLRMVKKINGKNAAQIMFVVGADGALPHPQWKENLKFVLKLQQKLNEKYPGLAKPVWIVAKRYNQQVSNQAILIEVGGDGNLLSECLESTKYLAEVLDEVMTGE